MKILLLTLLVIFPLKSFSVWDMQVGARPDRGYMNFFFKGYIPWFERAFNHNFLLPNDPKGEFFRAALSEIDHWKVPSHIKYDQLLIGETTDKNYPITMYLHPKAREHSYIKRFKLSFTPEFISWDGKELCFLTFTETPGWRHIPRDGADYLSHFCKVKESFILKYISFISNKETKVFKNPFEGLIEYEITTFDKTKQVKSFFSVKTLHMASIPKNFYRYIMEHGSMIHMPLDKYSIDENNQMTVYYP